MDDQLQSLREEIQRVDEQLARLFVRRMNAAKGIAAYKASRSLPVFDPEQEKRVMERSASWIEDDVLRPLYVRFTKNAMDLSKEYQEALIASQDDSSVLSNTPVRISVRSGESSYDVFLQSGCLKKAGAFLRLNRKVMIVTDDGVPDIYAKIISDQCDEPFIHCVRQGEGSKRLAVYEDILRHMLREGFTRSDCVLAVGGGMVGDLAGFCAAGYMRGVDFYNVPTTMLAQTDSSIGSKTGVNLDTVKNIVGAFYPPRCVLVDPDALKTLSRRQIANGLAEAVKMALTCDGDLFACMESSDFEENLPLIIRRSLLIKKAVVEQDEHEQGLRKILNFGHTIGHGIESQNAGFYHGECVAMGMIPMCSPSVRNRLIPMLLRLGLPTSCHLNGDRVFSSMLHDKKAQSGKISCVYVENVGESVIRKTEPAHLRSAVDLVVKGDCAP